MKNRAIYTILAALSMVGISQGSAQDVDSSTDEVGTSISLSRTDELPTGYQWFDESLSLKRGTLAPLGEEAILVNDEAMCEISEREWGWYAGDCLSTDQLILQVSDTIDWVRIEKPSYLGHVTFGGWGLDEQRRLIERIETQLEEKANFTPPQWDDLAIAEHWRVEPTLNEEAKLLYFATSDMLSNEPGPLVKAVRFDRQGYVEFSLKLKDPNTPRAEIESEIVRVISAYEPSQGETYSDYRLGDEVVAHGPVGALSAVTGTYVGPRSNSWAAALKIILDNRYMFAAPFLLAFLWIRGGMKKKG